MSPAKLFHFLLAPRSRIPVPGWSRLTAMPCSARSDLDLALFLVRTQS